MNLVFLWNAFPELSVDMTCEANCTSAFYQQFPLKKSSNPCAMFAFECYFARIFSYIFSSIVAVAIPLCFTCPSLREDGEKTGRRGKDGDGAMVLNESLRKTKNQKKPLKRHFYQKFFEKLANLVPNKIYIWRDILGFVFKQFLTRMSLQKKMW